MSPSTLNRRALAALALTGVLVVGSLASPAFADSATTAAPAASSPTLTAPASVAPTSTTPTPEQQVATLINQKRAAAGLPSLKVYSVIASTAEAWGNHMVKYEDFHHSSSEWRADRLSSSGWASSGENLAAGYTSASATVAAWMGSSGHKANILGKSYRGMGVGYVSGGPYKHYWVVVFTVPKPAMPKGSTPSLSGSSKIGGTVYAKTSGWPSGTTLKWQWYREGKAISGATRSSYNVASGDIGLRLQAKVAASNSRYYPTSILSRYTKYVAV